MPPTHLGRLEGPSGPPPHPFCVRNLQLGVGWSLDRNHRLVLEAADGADVLVGHVAQRGRWSQGSDQFVDGCFKQRAGGVVGGRVGERGEPRVKDISGCLRVR